ncbi:MAG: hypothetical protein HZC17_04610 [Candidatus Omnitrophica bacterium]|nr:hypothetical protein [Candidatus Omnitrophota bacterium]
MENRSRKRKVSGKRMNRKKWLRVLMTIVICSCLIIPPAQSLLAQATPILQDFLEPRLNELNFTRGLLVHDLISVEMKNISSEQTPTRISINFPEESQAPRKFARAMRSQLPAVIPQPIHPRVIGAPRLIVVEATRVKTVTEKLEILSQALQDRNFKGAGKLKLNDFLDRFLSAAAVELSAWLSETSEDPEFQNLFRGKGPWILIFLAMSPTSFHEFLDDVDFPGASENILGAKRLPINMSVTFNGDNLEVEIHGDYNLAIKFKVNEASKVSLVN